MTVAVGGINGANGGTISSAGSTGTTALQGVFTPTGSMTTTRAEHTATLLRNGMVLFTGGLKNIQLALTSAEVYDPAAGTFTATGNMTVSRYNHAATLLPNGAALIVGG